MAALLICGPKRLLYPMYAGKTQCLSATWKFSCSTTKRSSLRVKSLMNAVPYILSLPLVAAVGMSSHVSDLPMHTMPDSSANLW